MRYELFGFAILAAASAASSNAQPIIQAVPDHPRIIVSGYGEVKYMPDVATITYSIRGEGPTSDDAVRALSASGVRIEAALSAIDRAIDPRTTEVRIAVVRSTDCKEQEYGAPQLSTGPCAIAGYVATQSVTLRTLAIKDAGTMVGLISRAGGLNPNINSFNIRDSRPEQQQAMAAAIADAATKAAAIAAASHVRLGPILTISSGPRNDVPEIVVSGIPVVRAPPAPPPPPPVPVKVTPEPLTTNSYIAVTYAIAQ